MDDKKKNALATQFAEYLLKLDEKVMNGRPLTDNVAAVSSETWEASFIGA